MNIFYNQEEKRLRSLWRLIIQGLMFGIGLLATGVVIGIVQVAIMAMQGQLNAELMSDQQALTEAMMNSRFMFAFNGIGLVIVMVLSFLIAGWLLDRRKFKEFGFRFSKQWFADFGFGLFLGAILMVLIFLAELAFGWIEVTDYVTTATGEGSAISVIVASLIGYICVGIYEEMLSRGYHLRNLAEGLNFKAIGPRAALWLAYLISSSIFGILHATNPNASLVSTVNIILAGFFLGLGFVLTGELAIPIGLHITWNFFQGNVFGFPVSGNATSGTFIQTLQLGPDWMTGGAFGPEAGVIGILAIIVGSLLTILYVKQTRGAVALQYDLAVYEPKYLAEQSKAVEVIEPQAS